MTVYGALVELGIHTPAKPGRRAIHKSPEEALRVQKDQMKAAQIARKQAAREAKERGEDPPVFKRGHPSIYASKEEALAAQRARQRVCSKLYVQRMEESVRVALREHVRPEPSSDEHKNIEHV